MQHTKHGPFGVVNHHCPFSTTTVWVVHLSLDEGILLVIFEELSKLGLATKAKVYHDGISILLTKVTEMAEHLCHCLPILGSGLVVLA